jgi:putative addiction module killer protein
MIEVLKSETFARWIDKLKDRQAVARINARVLRLSLTGQLGDAKALRGGVSEMRIDHGPGYRVYFTRRGATLVLLLAGGDKRSQDRDIELANRIARDWKEPT